MIELALLLAGAFATLVCVGQWRRGLLVCVVIGLLQDPARKMMPGQPVQMTALVGIFVVLVLFGARLRGVPLRFRELGVSFPYLGTPVRLFVIVVVLQSLAAYLRTGSAVIAGIGLLAYLAPIPAVLLGYQFARGEADVVRFARWYIGGCLLMGTGIYLSYLGSDWAVLRQVGQTQISFSPSGEVIQLWSGFFRTPETAAWHLATAICLTITLAVLGDRSRGRTSISVILIALLGTALLLTGRRKWLVEIVLFLGCYVALIALFQRTAQRLSLMVIGSILAGAAVYLSGAADSLLPGLDPYLARGAAAQGTFGMRVNQMTLESFRWVIDQNGLFGSGAGTGSQGAQHFGGGANLVGMAAEGGAGKVLAELGIPGLVVLAWLAVALCRLFWTILRDASRRSPRTARLTDALVALLMANAVVFVTAHQAFGDLFVLLMLGWLAGFLLATTKPVNIVTVVPPYSPFAPRGGAAVERAAR